MKTFHCSCGNTLHFENSQCLVCNRTVGYLPDAKQLSAMKLPVNGRYQSILNNRYYRPCKNYAEYNVCNWMVPVEDNNDYCVSCRLNHIIPNLNEAENLTLWYRIELAKRRLLYTLFGLNLPVVSRAEDVRQGMAFEFLQEASVHDEFSNEVTSKNNVMTGHSAGLITINLLEARHSSRMEMREKMNERYRTLLGHFRHESGHYYWERLINETDNIQGFREVFGDERVNYQQAMNNYYESGPSPHWQDSWISAYASSHPWEDWAETWAHYLHMVDTLETAQDFGFRIHGHDISALQTDSQMMSGYVTPASFKELFDDWCSLSVALNALNRSMGKEDAYPFVVSNTSLGKLQYIHRIVTEAGR